MKRAFLDVNRACAGLLLRLGLDSIRPGEQQQDRFPCGKLRTTPKVVRIKRIDLSRAKRNTSHVTRHTSLSQ